MNRFLKNNTSFKSKLIYVDDNWIKTRIKTVRSDAETLNKELKEVKQIFKRELTDDELVSVVNIKWPYVVELLKSEANFNNAAEETLLSLMGIDPKPLKEILFRIRGISVHDLSIKNSQFYVSDALIKKINEIGTYFTVNEQQNDALDCYSQLVEVINSGIDKGVILDHSFKDFTMKRYFSASGKTKNGNDGFKVNFGAIRENFRNIKH